MWCASSVTCYQCVVLAVWCARGGVLSVWRASSVACLLCGVLEVACYQCGVLAVWCASGGVLAVWRARGGVLSVWRAVAGTSDPYVKFKMGRKQCYKSRIVYKNLNPKWDEKFTLPIEDPYVPIQVKVFDYDRCLSDDHMGSASLDPSTLHLDMLVSS